MTAVQTLDLRGTPCPVNFIRCKLALEALQPGDQLSVQLDRHGFRNISEAVGSGVPWS